jgi:ABC-type uncharacterized transport system permease subunit
MGLNLVYLYHLTPFVFLVTLPAFRGIRRQWIEAALTLGATRCSSGATSACPC